MYYRKKCILALFQVFGDFLGKTEFQKYLFLFSRKQTAPCYDFVPYKYGSFSFQAQNDIKSLLKTGFILDHNNKWNLIKKDLYLDQLSQNDRDILLLLHSQYNNLPLNEIIRRVYTAYPYYCKNSLIKNNFLNDSNVAEVEKSIQSNNENILFTIGYEGTSIENYINRLIDNNIKLVIDVRGNPVSMKYGFSKNRLSEILQKMSIRYYHIPELGVPSDLRKKYINKDSRDYEGLFQIYRIDILPKAIEFLNKICAFLEEKIQIALTCFEANPDICHRKIVAEKIAEEYLSTLMVNHI